MDFTFLSITVLTAVLASFQNSLALSPGHIQAKKMIRLLDNSISSISNHSRMLTVDGHSLEVQSTRDMPIRLYVEVMEAGMPLTLLVEPQCGVLAKWTILLVEYAPTGDTWRSFDVVHPQTKEKSSVEVIDTEKRGVTTELADYKSTEFSEFRLDAAPAGLYIINLTTTTDGRTIVSAAQEKEVQLQYPRMPSSRKIVLAKTGIASFTFYWERAALESETGNSASKMRYCVVVSKKEAITNICAAQKALTEGADRLYHYECFHGRTYFMLSGVSSSATLYLNVFAIHPESNKSRAYDGIKLDMPELVDSTELRQGAVLNSKIRHNKGYEVFRFKNIAHTGLKFSLVSCDTTVTFCIAFDGRVVRCQKVTQSVGTYILRDAKPGSYIITLTSSGERNSQFRLFAATLGARQPFPNLPSGRVVRQWSRLRTCQSITLAWIGVNGRQQYCLYVRPLMSNRAYRKPGLCSRANDIQENELVYCTYKRLRRRERTVFTKTVKNLQPCTRYEFVVQVKKIRASESLMYKPIRAETKCRKC